MQELPIQERYSLSHETLEAATPCVNAAFERIEHDSATAAYQVRRVKGESHASALFLVIAFRGHVRSLFVVSKKPMTHGYASEEADEQSLIPLCLIGSCLSL